MNGQTNEPTKIVTFLAPVGAKNEEMGGTRNFSDNDNCPIQCQAGRLNLPITNTDRIRISMLIVREF